MIDRKKDRTLYESMAIADFPNFVLSDVMKNGVNRYIESLREIVIDYYNYKQGSAFFPEGSNGDYVPSMIRFKLIKSLIDKEARFMFSRMPDINISLKNTSEEDEDIKNKYEEIISKVIEGNNFSSNLLSGAKDCLIGKRVACVVDFSETIGAGICFYNSLEFYYETDYSGLILTKFVSFKNVSKTKHSQNNIFLVNKYERENDSVYMSSIVYDSAGKIIETLIPWGLIALKYIPAIIIKNVGLLEDEGGVSDCEDILSYEEGYNRIGNADIDSERQGMNPVTVLLDINHETTKRLSIAPGSVWDLETSQLLNNPKPNVLKLAPQLGHSEAVKTTLDRLRLSAYSQLDIPDISAEGVLSGVTSYKAVRSLYFPLKTRCDEKIIEWRKALSFVFQTVLDLCFLNPDLVEKIYEVDQVEKIEFKIEVVENYALLADEIEEKQLDLEEINTGARSRKSYMKKWRSEEYISDDLIDKELEQIAVENNMMDTLSMNNQIQKRMEEKDMEEDIEDKTREEEEKEVFKNYD